MEMKKLVFLVAILLVGCTITGNVIVDSDTVELGAPRYKYFDFDKNELSNVFNIMPDIRIRRIGSTKIVLSTFGGAKIAKLNKDISKAEISDCYIPIEKPKEDLQNGDSMCVKTREGWIAVIGGTWGNNQDAKLQWKISSSKGCREKYYNECSGTHYSYYKSLDKDCKETALFRRTCANGCDETTGVCR